ncbi:MULTISPECIES: GNAT family N-acetyltransferase [unclassified Zunongwangia]|uniref:GNAT family N-acetyltransferase n=1 Tax=unclassified Zunongwangia TaxID=2632541 RepID=UPI0022DDE4B4|nr:MULTISPECIES: GNAT family N-acetyltransferase [unclassified Zunongwangia]WBL21512.1 GNAT family N-acetyltransferase [Zunongwangia sp. HRR-M8]WBL26542.1 GNAT family N-acetyltransferase [Zunongwangia sp. HGR-M22]
MEKPIKHKDNDRMGMFYLEGEKGIIAELTYTKKNEHVITVDHTEVKRQFEGQGIATRLVKEAVKFARDNNLKIDPLCPFTEVMFDRNPEYSDVRA